MALLSLQSLFDDLAALTTRVLGLETWRTQQQQNNAAQQQQIDTLISRCDAFATRIAAVEQRTIPPDLSGSITALAARVTALEQRTIPPDSTAALGVVRDRVTLLEQRTTGVDALPPRITALEQRAIPPDATAAVSALAGRVVQLEQRAIPPDRTADVDALIDRVDELADRVIPPDRSDDVDDLEDRVDALERRTIPPDATEAVDELDERIGALERWSRATIEDDLPADVQILRGIIGAVGARVEAIQTEPALVPVRQADLLVQLEGLAARYVDDIAASAGEGTTLGPRMRAELVARAKRDVVRDLIAELKRTA